MMMKLYRRVVTWSSVVILCGIVFLFFPGEKLLTTTTNTQQQQQQQHHDVVVPSTAAVEPSSSSSSGLSLLLLQLPADSEEHVSLRDTAVATTSVTSKLNEDNKDAVGFLPTKTAAAAAAATVGFHDTVAEQQTSGDEKHAGSVDGAIPTTTQSSPAVSVESAENDPKWPDRSSDIIADLSDSRRHRVQMMKHCCKDYKFRKTIKRYGRPALQQVLFSKKLKSAYCRIGKVSSSTWLGILNTALGDPHPSHNRAGTHMRTYLSISPEHRRYFKFVFVRHPFDRLVSAFLDKFRWDKSDEYKQLSARIIHKYRPKDQLLQKQELVQFDEVIQYVVDPSSQPLNDVHFDPQTVICQPCEVRYDFIGHYETLYDDGDYVIKKLGIEKLVTFPQTKPDKLRTWKDRVRTMFANVSKPLVEQLKNFYLNDFQMFGYNPNI